MIMYSSENGCRQKRKTCPSGRVVFANPSFSENPCVFPHCEYDCPIRQKKCENGRILYPDENCDFENCDQV